MNPQWQQFLAAVGEQIGGTRVSDFGTAQGALRAALAGSIVAALPNLAIVEVSGDDAAAFLGGQLTSDLNAIPNEQSSLGAWCSPQGRVLALLRIWRSGGSWFLMMPEDLRETTIKRLQMYVLRARVQILDRSGDLMVLGVAGEQAVWVLRGLGAMPGAFNAIQHHGATSFIRLPDQRLRHLIVGTSAAAMGLWNDLTAVCEAVGVQAWELLDIEAGLPQITMATRDRFLPQMLNLDVLGGVSFSKGCYPGQEIVARLKYRGQLKQRLFIGHCHTTDVPLAGTRLASHGGDASAGEVLQACPHPDGGIALTAVVQIDLATSGNVHLINAAGPPVRVSPPPYLD